MDYFTKSDTFGAQWSFTLAASKIYFHKKRK